jgi:GNAT superfamily N-acetyltransferase
MSVFEVRNLSSADHLNDMAVRKLCIETISQGIEEFDRISQREANDCPLVLAIFDSEEQIVGGLLGKMLRGWLRIDMVWIAKEWRGLGLGRRLVQQAEEIAIAQGCYAAHLDTYSFQAPDFYLKVGYEVFGELKDYPYGETKYYFKKRLIEQ